MATLRGSTARIAPQNRTRRGNGNPLFLEGADGRTTLGRRRREVLAQIIQDIGGDPSEAQYQIACRAVSLSIWAETEEAKLAAGGELNVSAFTTATNTLRRLLETLGLERRSLDVTPALTDHLAYAYPQAPAAPKANDEITVVDDVFAASHKYHMALNDSRIRNKTK